MVTRKTTKKSSKKRPTKKAAKKAAKKAVKKTVALSKRADKKAAGKAAKGRKGSKRRPTDNNFRVKVRMYRQGLGDCFLITLPRKGADPYYVLIDCGVILGTKDPKIIMTNVVQDIINTTGGRLHLLAATHEHWDHVSGFLQARELWEGKTEDGTKHLEVGEVWVAWSENEKDKLAKKLRDDRHGMHMALTGAATRLRMGGEDVTADEVTSMLEFFGAAGGGRTTADALELIKGLSENLRYCDPADEPVAPDGTSVKIYTLGPPRDEKFLKRYKPSAKNSEVYGHGMSEMFMNDLSPALGDPSSGAPFDKAYQIPLAAAEQMPFFRNRYWGEDADSEEKNQSWRQVSGSWLDSSSALALQLDSATNNTSLVLAFELDDGDVLLFASDAQVGNWLSWQDLKWDVDGEAVTGPDLLRRTIFYKVGHHGSHNATLSELGLELMTGLTLAFMPVDHEMAKKKKWGKIPLTDLLNRLKEVTKGCVVRIDEDLPPQVKVKGYITEDPLFYEVIL